MKKIIIAAFVAVVALLPLGHTSASEDLQILSPRGGEKYTIGQTVNIRWSSNIPEDGTVTASLFKLKGDNWKPENSYEYVENSYPINLTTSQNTGSASWRVAHDIPSGKYVLQLDIYHTDKFSNQYATLYTQKPFQISNTGAATKNSPNIDSVNPNTADQGSEVTISGTNFKTDNRVYIKALGADSYSATEVSVVKSSKNSTTFKIDQYITPGNYEVYVENINGMSPKVGLIITIPKISPFPFITSVNPVGEQGNTTVSVVGGNFTEKNDISYFSNDIIAYPTEDDIGAGDSTEKDKLMYPGSGFISGVKSSDGKTLQFKLPSDTLPGTYAINIINSKGYSDAGYFTIANPDVNAAHTSGTNVRASDGTIYFINSGTRTPYPSPAVFLSYKFNSWSNVVLASQGDMELQVSKFYPPGQSQEQTYFVSPRNGSLVNEDGTVYIVSSDQRAAFASAKVFQGLGYLFSNVIPASISHLVTLAPLTGIDSAHPNGTLVSDNGIIYVMQNGYRVGVPNMAVLESWGYSASEIVPANEQDLKIPISYVIGIRPPWQLNM